MQASSLLCQPNVRAKSFVVFGRCVTASACRFTRRSAGKPEIRFFGKYKNTQATARQGV